MKQSLITLAIVTSMSFTAFAEEQKAAPTTAPAATTEAPADNKKDTVAPANDKAPGMGKGMMMGKGGKGKMNMKKMRAMMGDCMKDNKDGSMCEGKMMERCQERMEKGECEAMMKKMNDDKK